MSKPLSVCQVKDCDLRARGRGYCGKHYQRWWRYGDPLVLRSTPRGAPMAWLEAFLANPTPATCVLWPFAKGDHGYGTVEVGGRTILVHSLVLVRRCGPGPTGSEVLHGCRHRSCLVHLRWGTHAENMRDKESDGTVPRGSAHYASLLTEDDVLAIRLRRSAGESSYALGRAYGVSDSAIRAICLRRTWGWL